MIERDMKINDPATLAAVTAACDQYEAALMANDIQTLDALFWDSPLTLRYGAGENLYGMAEIRAFRQGRVGGSPPRKVLRREITCYGDAYATCNLEFRRAGNTQVGRQSQSWILTAGGWKITAAHVSLMAESH
jgi:hypothetical protein